MYDQKTLGLLGGKELLEQKIKANNFMGGKIFTQQWVLLAFSFHGCKHTNFLTISKRGKYNLIGEYIFIFYKISLFRHKKIKTIEDVTNDIVLSTFEKETKLKLADKVIQ
ncbi:hypothetical protein CIL05_07130 [Virgibacillus profundi]|uniref:Uncharacterized protein n=1 Tax=Virgibacillus profundi TaxID=2024555 RepID=A0A2A2IGL9_9BACI|nr:hypothetical protein [Virgibacillus profundi]PAV30233.1 hypothetical protein CIL05_07130 [Virgibacillus profundi]PXY54405.1 hypothetical protein CIT14_07215 [Virgibacillus profundi]